VTMLGPRRDLQARDLGGGDASARGGDVTPRLPGLAEGCSYTSSPVPCTRTSTRTPVAPAKAPACNGERAGGRDPEGERAPGLLQCAEKRDEIRSLAVGEDEAEMVFVVDDDVFERLRDAVVEVWRARGESP
jgi:hypothetical protein